MAGLGWVGFRRLALVGCLVGLSRARWIGDCVRGELKVALCAPTWNSLAYVHPTSDMKEPPSTQGSPKSNPATPFPVGWWGWAVEDQEGVLWTRVFLWRRTLWGDGNVNGRVSNGDGSGDS